MPAMLNLLLGGMLVLHNGKRTSTPASAQIFFKALGRRARQLRKKTGYSQSDMAKFGFRRWQQIENGRPITVTTLIRICEVFKIRLDDLLLGLGPELGPLDPPDLH